MELMKINEVKSAV